MSKPNQVRIGRIETYLMKLQIRRDGLLTALEMDPMSYIIQARMDELDRVIDGLTKEFKLEE